MPQAFIKDITSQHISVDIFLDTTSIELFVNNDEESITMRFEASQTLKNILKKLMIKIIQLLTYKNLIQYVNKN